MLLISGVSYHKIRLSYGPVDDNMGNKGDHVVLTYYLADKKYWVLIDTTYYPSNLLPGNRPDYKTVSYYKKTLFSWNEKYCFVK